MAVIFPGSRTPTDVAPNFGNSLLATNIGNPSLGLNVYDNTSQTGNITATNVRRILGTWFKVPDSSVKLIRGGLVFNRTAVWRLPDGSSIILDPSDVRYTDSLWHYTAASIADSEWDASDVYIRATQRTLAGLNAFGLALNIQERDIPNLPAPAPKPTFLDNVTKIADSGSKAVSGYATIAVVAGVVFLAVWLGGRNILKG